MPALDNGTLPIPFTARSRESPAGPCGEFPLRMPNRHPSGFPPQPCTGVSPQRRRRASSILTDRSQGRLWVACWREGRRRPAGRPGETNSLAGPAFVSWSVPRVVLGQPCEHDGCAPRLPTVLDEYTSQWIGDDSSYVPENEIAAGTRRAPDYTKLDCRLIGQRIPRRPSDMRDSTGRTQLQSVSDTERLQSREAMGRPE